MKKLVQINVVCNGSTGRIMCDIAKEANNVGMETYCFYGRGLPNKDLNCIKFGNKFSILLHGLLARFGFNGYGSYFATKKLINNLKAINPDIIHLHNIHGYYINLKLLFNYLKNEYKGKIVWTLHDCWAFTGHCSFFVMAGCDKWKKECCNCPQLDCYPKTLIDTSRKEFVLKKKMFSGINNMIITTPSNWLKKVVENSFLNEYQVECVYNGVDRSIFHKHVVSNSFFEKHPELKNKKIILGIANVWSERKGLKYFLDLSTRIPSDYKIVLVGLSDKQISELPNNILGLKRTESIEELAELYSNSHVFYNPSFEETFSLVTAEAMSCALPVIVFDSSAPSELVGNHDLIINKALFRSVEDVTQEVVDYITKKNHKRIENTKFSNEKMIKAYLKLYK